MAHPGAIAHGAIRTEKAIVREVLGVACRHPTITTIVGGDTDRHLGVPWTIILAVVTMILTVVTTHRHQILTVMADRMIDHRGTSLPGMPDTRGRDMDHGTMIGGAVTGKFNRFLRTKPLLNKRTRFHCQASAGQIVACQYG